jgi:hypothetical protein
MEGWKGFLGYSGGMFIVEQSFELEFFDVN